MPVGIARSVIAPGGPVLSHLAKNPRIGGGGAADHYRVATRDLHDAFGVLWRVHVAIADDGNADRLLHFGKWKGAGSASLQGDSVAEWETPHIGRGRGDPEASSGRREEVQAPQFGDLKVITNHLSGGYLRKNGVPYSADATMTEYWDLFKEPNGDQRIMLAMRVADPTYLITPWLTVLQFKKESSDAKWDRTPCSAKW